MRITYRVLRELMNRMNDEQLDCDVTVEYYDGDTECYAAELRIAGSTHDSLDENHPIIYCDRFASDNQRETDVDSICEKIGL